MINQDLILKPAYGRDYVSKKDLLADWEANKDFEIVATGQKINKADYEKYSPNSIIKFRYQKLTKVHYL